MFASSICAHSQRHPVVSAFSGTGYCNRTHYGLIHHDRFWFSWKFWFCIFYFIHWQNKNGHNTFLAIWFSYFLKLHFLFLNSALWVFLYRQNALCIFQYSHNAQYVQRRDCFSKLHIFGSGKELQIINLIALGKKKTYSIINQNKPIFYLKNKIRNKVKKVNIKAIQGNWFDWWYCFLIGSKPLHFLPFASLVSTTNCRYQSSVISKDLFFFSTIVILFQMQSSLLITLVHTSYNWRQILWQLDNGCRTRQVELSLVFGYSHLSFTWNCIVGV